MTHEGTVINGVIVLDGGANLPEGERVRVEILDDDNLTPPPQPYDRVQELALLREALEDVKAGRSRPFAEVMAEIAARYQLPPLQRR